MSVSANPALASSTAGNRRQKRHLVPVAHQWRSFSRSPRSPPRKSTIRSAPFPETRRPGRARRRRPSHLSALRATRSAAPAMSRSRANRRIVTRMRVAPLPGAPPRLPGCAVAPSIQTSPPSKNSCFQIGTICLTRSITYRHAANACGAMRARRGNDDAGFADRQASDAVVHRQPQRRATRGRPRRNLFQRLHRQRLVRLVLEMCDAPVQVVLRTTPMNVATAP